MNTRDHTASLVDELRKQIAGLTSVDFVAGQNISAGEGMCTLFLWAESRRGGPCRYEGIIALRPFRGEALQTVTWSVIDDEHGVIASGRPSRFGGLNFTLDRDLCERGTTLHLDVALAPDTVLPHSRADRSFTLAKGQTTADTSSRFIPNSKTILNADTGSSSQSGAVQIEGDWLKLTGINSEKSPYEHWFPYGVALIIYSPNDAQHIRQLMLVDLSEDGLRWGGRFLLRKLDDSDVDWSKRRESLVIDLITSEHLRSYAKSTDGFKTWFLAEVRQLLEDRDVLFHEHRIKRLQQLQGFVDTL